jgi:hypothetical protein
MPKKTEKRASKVLCAKCGKAVKANSKADGKKSEKKAAKPSASKRKKAEPVEWAIGEAVRFAMPVRGKTLRGKGVVVELPPKNPKAGTNRLVVEKSDGTRMNPYVSQVKRIVAKDAVAPATTPSQATNGTDAEAPPVLSDEHVESVLAASSGEAATAS